MTDKGMIEPLRNDGKEKTSSLLKGGGEEKEIEGEGRKRKGIHKGEFFPPYTEEDVFPSSVSLLYFFSF